jgi:hypothetical protein
VESAKFLVRDIAKHEDVIRWCLFRDTDKHRAKKLGE